MTGLLFGIRCGATPGDSRRFLIRDRFVKATTKLTAGLSIGHGSLEVIDVIALGR